MPPIKDPVIDNEFLGNRAEPGRLRLGPAVHSRCQRDRLGRDSERHVRVDLHLARARGLLQDRLQRIGARGRLSDVGADCECPTIDREGECISKHRRFLQDPLVTLVVVNERVNEHTLLGGGFTSAGVGDQLLLGNQVTERVEAVVDALDLVHWHHAHTVVDDAAGAGPSLHDLAYRQQVALHLRANRVVIRCHTLHPQEGSALVHAEAVDARQLGVVVDQDQRPKHCAGNGKPSVVHGRRLN
ncbi:hypothetical protein D3C79_691210 [compost metagenome]